ncbi:MAG: TetR/AcrR family transcriptional regulator [Streptococcaceae bacterium]|jgi:AcrR family transcriptional regulator|nr:TetR/AcrR family transcriptional regulator [Streptococcaceae bacterium]
MDGFERRKKKKMNEIITATIHLLNTKNVNELTMQQIANHANVAKVTLFNYYTNKDNLINTAIIQHFEDVVKHYNEIIESPMSFEQTYKDLTHYKMSKFDEMSAIFFENIMEVFKSEHSFYNQNEFFNADELYLRLFQKGRKEGKVNPAYDDKLLLALMRIYTEGLKSIDWTQDDFEKYADQLTQIFMNSIR